MMVPVFPHILAESDGTAKLLGLIIFGAIWALGALANWWAKQQKEQQEAKKREQVRRSIEAQRASAAVASQQRASQMHRANAAQRAGAVQRQAPPRPAQARRPAQPPQRMAPPPIPSRRDIAARGRRPAPPPLAAPEEPVVTSPLIQEAPPVATRRLQPTSAGATAINQWLKPNTLRQQFILTELLQPPIALRDADL